VTPASAALIVLLAAPLAGVVACLLPLPPGWKLRLNVLTSGLALMSAMVLTALVWGDGRVTAGNGTFMVDTLSAYHLCLVGVIFFASSVYAVGYFEREIAHGRFLARRVGRFCMLWQGFLAVMSLVLVSNNMGLLWVALEGTTLVSAFLILTDGQRSSIEAMWKYLLVCSVGILFAFVGTLLLSVAARGAATDGAWSLQWTWLYEHATAFQPRIMLAAFIFALVGFGTKAGLAPMHTWLPDAHSQAPTPVSAVFSGVMLNCALYCIMRYLPLAEGALHNDGQAHQLLLLFGLVSMVVAAVFIPTQTDIKRLLAYHSVEHMGIIAVGLGLGGLGTFAALFHTLNHSLSKTLAFFSAGRLVQDYGTRDMRRMRGALGVSPVWGAGFFVSILILIGVAPFSVFMSELQILKTAVDNGRYVSLVVFLFASVIIFVSALKHAMDVSFGAASVEGPSEPRRAADISMVLALSAALLLLGLWIPGGYAELLRSAAAIVEGGR
jgi:hydrogenase-4 component F